MAAEITKYKSVKDVPKDQILATSADGKTVVLFDGTKVSDELIREAHTAERAQSAAAAAAARAGKELLDDPDFVERVSAIAEAAARKVWNEEKAKTQK